MCARDGPFLAIFRGGGLLTPSAFYSVLRFSSSHGSVAVVCVSVPFLAAARAISTKSHTVFNVRTHTHTHERALACVWVAVLFSATITTTITSRISTHTHTHGTTASSSTKSGVCGGVLLYSPSRSPAFASVCRALRAVLALSRSRSRRSGRSLSHVSSWYARGCVCETVYGWRLCCCCCCLAKLPPSEQRTVGCRFSVRWFASRSVAALCVPVFCS